MFGFEAFCLTCAVMDWCNASLNACQFSSGDRDEGFPVKNCMAY